MPLGEQQELPYPPHQVWLGIPGDSGDIYEQDCQAGSGVLRGISQTSIRHRPLGRAMRFSSVRPPHPASVWLFASPR
jgi:hypothetical protein